MVSKLESASYVSPPCAQRASQSSASGTKRQRMQSASLDDGDQQSADFGNLAREDVNIDDTNPGKSLLHGNGEEYRASGL